MQPRIENAQQILDIIEPIPADKFIAGKFGNSNTPDDGCSCFGGHIHRALSPAGTKDFLGDFEAYGAFKLTARFLKNKYGLDYANGATVNNCDRVNGYTESVIKDRVVHLLKDMIAAGY